MKTGLGNRKNRSPCSFVLIVEIYEISYSELFAWELNLFFPPSPQNAHLGIKYTIQLFFSHFTFWGIKYVYNFTNFFLPLTFRKKYVWILVDLFDFCFVLILFAFFYSSNEYFLQRFKGTVSRDFQPFFFLVP